MSGFGFAAKPKVPAAQEAGGDRKRRRVSSGAGSQDDPITIDEEETEEVVIRETQFAGLTQSPGWESDSDLDLDLDLSGSRFKIGRKSGGAGKLTPRFSPAKRKKGMAPRFSSALKKVISPQEEKEWDVMATSGVSGEREKSSGLMPPPPVTPKRPRVPLQLPEEIPSSQSPVLSPLKTQLTQAQLSPTTKIGGQKITSPLIIRQSCSPLKTRVGGIAPPVGWTGTRTFVKSSQWWENEDTLDNFSETESEGEGGIRKGVRNNWTKPPLRSQVVGTQDGNDIDSSLLSPLHSTPRKPKISRLSERENREDEMETTTDDEDSTTPLHSPTQPLSNTTLREPPRQQAQEVDTNTPPNRMESVSPVSESSKEFPGTSQPSSLNPRSPADQAQKNGNIDMDTTSIRLEPASPLEEVQVISQLSTPRKSQSQREEIYGHDMDMTFDLGTPCKRQTTSPPPPSAPTFSHQEPQTPSPNLPRPQARETPSLNRSPARRSSLGTITPCSPSTVREIDPSSLTSFNLSPQRLQSQYLSVQETPPRKHTANTPDLVAETQINGSSALPEADDSVLDTQINDAPQLDNNHCHHDDSQMRITDDEYSGEYDDDGDNATDSQDPSMEFYPVKTQQFPHSMFVRSVTDMTSPSPSQSPTNVSQDVRELVLERMEKEVDVGLPPSGSAIGTQGVPGLLTTSQLLPETLMESFPLPPPLTQFSSYPGDETQ